MEEEDCKELREFIITDKECYILALVAAIILAALLLLLVTVCWPCDTCEMQNRICSEWLEKHPEVSRCDAWRHEIACMRITTDEDGNPCYLEAFDDPDYRSRVTADPEPMFEVR